MIVGGGRIQRREGDSRAGVANFVAIYLDRS